MALVLVTAPTEEPVTLTEAKNHLRVDTTDDDTLISSLIVAARQIAEIVTRRALITQTWDLFLDKFPEGDYITIPLPSLRSVASLKYTDKDGTETTWGTSNYIVDIKNEPGRVVLAYGKSWPSVTLYPANPIAIRFEAGYGAAAAVPKAIKHAMLLLIAQWYENREPIVTGTVLNELPFAVNALLWPYRILRWL